VKRKWWQRQPLLIGNKKLNKELFKGLNKGSKKYEDDADGD
jgi:hypothetical protein|tara:strand:+ start:3907 stop:4029 length:123 start_codon:yes stop_codon:yes gene_type:complete